MNPLAVFKTKPDADVLALRGTRVPKFERSILFAASRDALRVLNEVHQVPADVAEKWLDTEEGKQLRNLLRKYVAHVSLVGAE